MRQGGFAKAWRTVQQYMIQRIAAQFGRLHENTEVFQNLFLAREISKRLRTQHFLQFALYVGQFIGIRIQIFVHFCLAVRWRTLDNRHMTTDVIHGSIEIINDQLSTNHLLYFLNQLLTFIWMTPKKASRNIRVLILELPSVRSVKMIGISTPLIPYLLAVSFISIWTAYPTHPMRSSGIGSSTSRL